ncbi:MAG: ATP-binding cassette domain-containing protein, partial [Xanthomonadales bacterium]|nr:ATP-binding cassette domain-containing protein [Xanthomonadales bacterium]
MLGFNQLSLRRGRLLLFEDVTFQLHAGNRLGLVGANGSGKSSLFAMVLGQLEPDEGVLSINPADRLSHVAQESPSGPGSALDYVVDGDRELRSVQAAITKTEQAGHAQGIDLLYEQLDRLDGFTADARAARLLHGLGFAEDSHRTPVQEFSGGWRMRLNLARALMCPSEILLLDEPTNHLDIEAITWLEEFLSQYSGTFIFVSHDRAFVKKLATRIIELDRGRLTSYDCSYETYLVRKEAALKAEAVESALFDK